MTVEEALLGGDDIGPPDANVEVASDAEEVDALTAEPNDKLEMSGGTVAIETVGVGGVLASDRDILLPSGVCLLTTLATGMFGAPDVVFPADWDGENLFEVCSDGGLSALILARDGGDEPLEDGDGVGGDRE